MITLRGLVRNVFPTPEFVDKATGVVTPAGSKVQIEYEELVSEAGDKKIVLDDFNVRNLGDSWRKALNKHVYVPIGMMSDLGTKKVSKYIPKGALPTIAA